MHPSTESDSVPLLRAGRVVSGLLGAFGSQLQETRLTGALGYFCSLEPASSAEFFGFPGTPVAISVEHPTEEGRSDIRIETDEGVGIVEAKLGAWDPHDQAIKYPADWRVSLNGIPLTAMDSNSSLVRSISWRQTGLWLQKCRPQCRPISRIVAEEILHHLEDYNMISRQRPVEIYARDLGDADSVRLFLEFGLYLCPFKANSRLAEALYFAPCLSTNGAAVYPGLRAGLSHIARIEQVEVATTLNSAIGFLKGLPRKHFSAKALPAVKGLLHDRKWTASGTFVLLLGQRRMLFHPPIPKKLLQRGDGFLSTHFFSFDQLFKAHDGEPAYD